MSTTRNRSLDTVVAYLRVSSRSQTCQSQRFAIKECAKHRSERAPIVFVEEKASGKKLDREILNEIRQRIRRHEISRIYVFSIDRITRSGIRDTFEFLDECRRFGCEVVSVRDGFALDNDVVMAVMAWAAQMERRALGERISAARTRMEAQGIPWGRPGALTAKEAEKLRALVEEENLTQAEAAKRFGISRPTVQRILAQHGHYTKKVKT